MNTQRKNKKMFLYTILVTSIFLFSGIGASYASSSSGEVKRHSKIKHRVVITKQGICVPLSKIRESKRKMYQNFKTLKKEKYSELKKKFRSGEISFREMLKKRKNFVQTQRETKQEFLQTIRKIKRGGIKNIFEKENFQKIKNHLSFLPKSIKGEKVSIKICR